MPALPDCTFTGAEVTLRPGSPRTSLLLGQLPDHDNVIVASGHFRQGILMAPITGQMVADLVTEKKSDPIYARARVALIRQLDEDQQLSPSSRFLDSSSLG